MKDDLWVVADTIMGEGPHEARLHWLAGDYPFDFDASTGSLCLETPEGPFSVTILDGKGNPIPSMDVVRGPGHTGTRLAIPLLWRKNPGALAGGHAIRTTTAYPVTLMGAGRPRVSVEAGEWEVVSNGHVVRFAIEAGSLGGFSVTKSVPELQA